MAGYAGGMALIQPGWLAVRALWLPVRALAARARALWQPDGTAACAATPERPAAGWAGPAGA